MTYSFTARTEIEAPADDVFRMSLGVDAHIASTPGSGEQAIAGTTSGQLDLGDTVTWRARHFGIWWRMTSRISELERPTRFVDEQVHGPFARFRHEHLFRDVGSRTEMVDHVELVAPAGWLGRPIERWIIGPYIEQLIRQRNSILRDLLEADEYPPI